MIVLLDFVIALFLLAAGAAVLFVFGCIVIKTIRGGLARTR